MSVLKKIFTSKITLIVAALISFAVSCKKEKPPTHTVYMSQEVMDYFVNYDPGTCWVYKDSAARNSLDTIELMSKERAYYDDGDGALYQGFKMNYTSNRSLGFWILAGANPSPGNSSSATFYTATTGGDGTLEAIYNGGIWIRGAFYDSLTIASGKKYHMVLKMGEGCSEYNNMRIAKDSGIVAFNSIGTPSQEGAFYLVAKFKK